CCIYYPQYNASICRILTSADCTACGGTYKGDNTSCTAYTCAPPKGACCLRLPYCSFDSCYVLSPSSCAGYHGTYLGDGVACCPTSCGVTGACCIPGH